jgi:hypothetical protein
VDHLTDLPRTDTGWADQHAETKPAERGQSDEPSEWCSRIVRVSATGT